MPGEVQEFVSLTPWTMIFEVVNLLIVMLILKKFLFKPVNAVLEQRQAEIGGMYQKAEDAQKEAQALKPAYDERMSGARKEADELIVAAQDSARRRGDEIVEDARDEAVQLRRRAEEDIELQKRKALREARDELADMAVDIAGKVVEREVTREDHDRLVEEFIKSAGDEP